jgi:Flp pilus assembly protein CpaB
MELAQRLFSTRGGTLILAGLSAGLAAVAVLVYLSKYRSSVKASGQPATVLVAKTHIAKGTPGSVVASSHLFQAISLRESQLRPGAISDPVTLTGRVAATDIFPRQQLTADQFKVAPETLASQLVRDERAITLPLDKAHGLISNLHQGDRVDIYAGFNVVPIDKNGQPIQTGTTNRPMLRLIVQNAPVMSILSGKSSLGGTSGEGNVTLKVSSNDAAKLAFASDNGKLWLVLRPPSGAKAARPDVVTVETELLGLTPVQALKLFGGRG